MKAKAIFVNLVFMLAVLLFIVPIVAFCQADMRDNDPHMTGLIRPAPQEREKELKSLLKLKNVHLNKLGLQRVNAHMLKKGMFTLGSNMVVPFGSEIEAAVGEPAAGAQAILSAGPSVNIPSGALPAYVDNSQLKYFPPIRSQGSLGSCASWASVYYAMTHMYAMVRDLDAKNGGDAYNTFCLP